MGLIDYDYDVRQGMWEHSDESENNRLVRLVKDTDWPEEDKNEICMAISAQTVKRSVGRCL